MPNELAFMPANPLAVLCLRDRPERRLKLAVHLSEAFPLAGIKTASETKSLRRSGIKHLTETESMSLRQLSMRQLDGWILFQNEWRQAG
ncbi:MAG: hypothetical protein PHQ34_01140 [Methanothrix sp.]|nr:hypothetical protein [Methanothrix sp.]